MKKILLSFLIAVMAAPPSGPARTQDVRDNRPVRREVCVTFDDLPATHGGLQTMKYVTGRLLETIKAERIPAVGFVNEGKLYVRGEVDERTALLRMWLDHGLELGNHSFSHIYIDQVPVSAYKEDVIRGETVTRMLLREQGGNLRYYRHTQLRTGPTPEYKKELDAFLAERGYTVAPVTIDNNDYVFADVYSRARRRGDTKTMERVAAAYISYMESIFSFFEELSTEALGYEVKQILLLHANELNADHFEDLVKMMRRRGYSFISLEEALKDKAYRLPEAHATRGLSWLHRWMLAKGMKMKPEPREPEFITEMFDAGRR